MNYHKLSTLKVTDLTNGETVRCLTMLQGNDFEGRLYPKYEGMHRDISPFISSIFKEEYDPRALVWSEFKQKSCT